MCRVLDVSTSAYYEWLRNPVSPHAQADKSLAQEVKESHQQSRGIYGARRIQKDLEAQGRPISRRRVRRLMKEQGLRSQVQRRFVRTTDSDHGLPVAENLLKRGFDVPQPNQVYVTDITYIHTASGWLYLAVILDLYSRSVVGWGMREDMSAGLVTDALKMAIRFRKPPPGLIIHSDRGSQYASHSWQNLLKKHQFLCSMSRKGDCWDNAVAESFFHTLKSERVHHQHYQNQEEATKDLFEYIEVFYNRKRRHSTIGYLSPFEYEELKQAA